MSNNLTINSEKKAEEIIKESAQSTHSHHVHHENMIMDNSHKINPLTGKEIFSLSMSSTLHCLLGCGFGEVAGMVISTLLSLSMLSTMIFSILLGFIAGILLGIMPLLKKGFSVNSAVKTVLISEGLSIAVMEAFEYLTQLLIPGVMEAGLTDGIFWAGMISGLIVGFIAALPVNYIMIKRGIRHQH